MSFEGKCFTPSVFFMKMPSCWVREGIFCEKYGGKTQSKTYFLAITIKTINRIIIEIICKIELGFSHSF